jgi:hypothetical protein
MSDAKERVKKMVNAIQQEANERAKDIKENAKGQFEIE